MRCLTWKMLLLKFDENQGHALEWSIGLCHLIFLFFFLFLFYFLLKFFFSFHIAIPISTPVPPLTLPTSSP